jgi:hypothetical protein
MKVKNFTVSKGLDLYRSGEKNSYFVSMNVEPDEDMSVDEFLAAQLDMAIVVKRACIHNALTDGKLKLEEANEMIALLKENTALLREKLGQKK